ADDAGFNVVQIQTVNDVPAYNVYGAKSVKGDYDFDLTTSGDDYGYWDHVDYIVDCAAKNGIYVGMVCIWGGLVKGGKMTVEQARRYGRFLGERYADNPNIIWIIGGDIRGDVKTEEWVALARSIREADDNHLMTFHPFGRTCSATWFNDADWLDFNMFQSGHRRYGQRKGDGDHSDPQDNEEDNWRYAEAALAMTPVKPVLDAEPSYEDIPQGLHDTTQPRWTARDVRRYAYWSVFAGSCGHTYGNNSIMQFYRPGLPPAYGAEKTWVEALDCDGFNQMKHLKRLFTIFPLGSHQPDRSVIQNGVGERYDRLTALRGSDFILVYDYSGREATINTDKLTVNDLETFYYSPVNGRFTKAPASRKGNNITFTPVPGEDVVLVVVAKGLIETEK
ncbi:MAG: glycoside hydrolase family 140 protein, partial [Muribaculaceae bacterium]|nr:glycoside hydrolase family 140 protein [Muribaculaceae bacterium]